MEILDEEYRGDHSHSSDLHRFWTKIAVTFCSEGVRRRSWAFLLRKIMPDPSEVLSAVFGMRRWLQTRKIMKKTRKILKKREKIEKLENIRKHSKPVEQSRKTRKNSKN